MGADLLEEHISPCCARVLQGQGIGSFSFQESRAPLDDQNSSFGQKMQTFLWCGVKAAGAPAGSCPRMGMSTQLGCKARARSTGDTAVLLGTSSAEVDFGICLQ